MPCDVAIAVVVGAVVVASTAIALATWLAQRRRATRMVELDRALTRDEAVSGRCGACDGRGYRWTGTSLGRARPCWRCGGFRLSGDTRKPGGVLSACLPPNPPPPARGFSGRRPP